jgi:hypothetical protein
VDAKTNHCVNKARGDVYGSNGVHGLRGVGYIILVLPDKKDIATCIKGRSAPAGDKV